MKDPLDISIKDYSYELPEDRIAKYPLSERDVSRLLIYENGKISEDLYRHISSHIPADSLLIFNDTKVVEARLLFQKDSGGIIEIFCLEPHERYADITSAMLQKEKVLWKCLVGGASKWKPGQILEKKIKTNKEDIILNGRYLEKRPDLFIIELSWTDPELSFAEILHLSGAIPLPPYIKRAEEDSDAERYQTVYAKIDGSVAAPTAGLHFTENIFKSLENKNIRKDFVTLHVGAGTFKPVKSETMRDHVMHSEWIDVSRAAIENILANLHKNIIGVGTTSLRTLESLYWIGRAEADSDPLSSAGSKEPHSILRAVLTMMDKRKIDRLITKTDLLILPGYEFKIVNGLITNFHQPQSTLLLLVAALVGENWKKIYDYALENDFRFLSYGDGCLLWKKRD